MSKFHLVEKKLIQRVEKYIVCELNEETIENLTVEKVHVISWVFYALKIHDSERHRAVDDVKNDEVWKHGADKFLVLQNNFECNVGCWNAFCFWNV